MVTPELFTTNFAAHQGLLIAEGAEVKKSSRQEDTSGINGKKHGFHAGLPLDKIRCKATFFSLTAQ